MVASFSHQNSSRLQFENGNLYRTDINAQCNIKSNEPYCKYTLYFYHKRRNPLPPCSPIASHLCHYISIGNAAPTHSPGCSHISMDKHHRTVHTRMTPYSGIEECGIRRGVHEKLCSIAMYSVDKCPHR